MSVKTRQTDGLQRADLSNHTKLLFTRKPNHPELIFNEKLQISDNVKKNHFDIENCTQQWALNFEDSHCYVCNKFPYIQVFYRRCKANKEYEEITNPAEIKNL